MFLLLQNQFTVLREHKPVYLPTVIDQQLSPAGQQFVGPDDSRRVGWRWQSTVARAIVSRFRFVHGISIGGKGRSVLHCYNIVLVFQQFIEFAARCQAPK